MSHNIAHNLLNLPDSVTFADGNGLCFVYMADGRRVSTDSYTQSTPLVLPGAGGGIVDLRKKHLNTHPNLLKHR